jgi:hypothetical protein
MLTTELIKHFMKYKLFMLTLPIIPNICSNNFKHTLKLEKLIVVCRHGPRQPIMIPPKFDFSLWLNHDKNNYNIKAQLTNIGKLYCQFRGKELYDSYKNHFDLNKAKILVESSFFDRTIDSTISYLSGLNLDIKKEDIILSNFLASDKCLTPEENIVYHNAVNNYKLKMNTDELDNQIKEVTGHVITKPMDYFDIHSTINCYKVHNYILPENLNLVEKQLHKITVLFYNLLNDVENNYALLLGSRLYDHIMDIINSDTTFAFLSTHDNSIMPFVKYIHKKYNKDSFIDLPDFCSTVRFEIWSSENIRVLKIYYDTILIIEINV